LSDGLIRTTLMLLDRLLRRPLATPFPAYDAPMITTTGALVEDMMIFNSLKLSETARQWFEAVGK
jgi:hypothetical protein